MIINNSEVIQLKCSEFIHADPIINEYTAFLVSDIPYRSHDLYLILKFIIRKYKKLILIKFKRVTTAVKTVSFTLSLYNLL